MPLAVSKLCTKISNFRRLYGDVIECGGWLARLPKGLAGFTPDLVKVVTHFLVSPPGLREAQPKVGL